jgi:predicted nuclease of predicted toxin-antitoxin system
VKLLFDQNLSPSLVTALDGLFPGSTHVAKVQLDRASDREVAAYASAHGFAVVTKDADFDELRLVLDDFPRIIWVQRGNCSTREIEHLLRANAAAIQSLEGDPETTLLMLR